MSALLWLLLAAQDPIAPLLRDLEDDSPDVRALASAKLRELGPAALAALKRSPLPAAREIAARIEWEPVVPLWADARDPGIFLRLAGGDSSAYDGLLRQHPQRLFLDRKILAVGPWPMKKRVLEKEPAFSIVVDALLSWDHAACPLEQALLVSLAETIVAHATPESADLLRRLGTIPGTIGLAALGDKEAGAAAIRLIEDAASPWRVPAIQAVGRARDPRAGPALRDLLRRAPAESILAALEALDSYPDLELRKELVDLLTYASKNPQTIERIQAEALRQLAARKIDESKRIWDLFNEGRIKSVIPMRGEQLSPVEAHLGPALLLADDPAVLDWIGELRALEFGMYMGLHRALLEHAPPRLVTYLHDVAAGRKKAPPDHAKIADGYLERHPLRPPPLSPAEAWAILEKEAGPRSPEAFDAMDDPDRASLKFLALCGTWTAAVGHPLRGRAALLLHRLGKAEGTDALLDLARSDEKYLDPLQGEPRARPLLHEKLKRDPEDGKWDTVRLLAALQDEAAPPQVFQWLREGKHVTSGDGVWRFLKPYADRDFTEDLLAILKQGPPDGHVEQALRYIAWKERKDQAPLLREFLTHRNYSVRNVALDALGRWGDRESYDRIEAWIPKAGDSLDLHAPLRAMERIDPARTLRFVRPLLGLPPTSKERGPALSCFLGLAEPGDHALLVRLVRTEARARYLYPAAARRRIPEAFEPLLALAEVGAWSAAGALAYFGDPRAIPVLARRLDEERPLEIVNALDYLVHRDRYPDLTARRILGKVYTSLPFPAAAAKAKECFGIEFHLGVPADRAGMYFSGEEDLPEWLEEQCDGALDARFAHLWRDGKVHLIPLDEARAHWKRWWAENARFYK